ncbi:MAG: glucosamine-6-phosphate deaminase [Sporomusaceae bacterium]|nr:glucosamine-6-phosphate deaminase [Sporomusaceae bacterium]
MEYVYAPGEALGREAARWVARQILRCPQLVLGLPTGGTPIPMYRQLVRLYQETLISFASVRTFNLDEYVGLAASHPQSYHYYMQQHFWSLVDLPAAAREMPRGDAADLAAECRRYDRRLEAAGGVDVQVLGIGMNGHIGFNEPSHNLSVRTHVVSLTPATIAANACFFGDAAAVPRQAITMGIGSIMQAKKILLLVSGEKKCAILRKTLFGPVTTDVPASILQLHAGLTVISDVDCR